MTVTEDTEERNPIRDPNTGRINHNQDAWNRMENTSPQYTIVPVPKKMNVDPGDSIKIDLFINGYGEIARSKLQLDYPCPDFITDDDIKGEIEYSVWLPDDEEPHTLYSVETSEAEYQVSEWGATALLEPEFFSPIRAADNTYPLLASEVAFADRPFISVELYSSEDADPGNYPIKHTFTYGDDENVFQDHKTSVIHINNAREQYEPWVTRAGIVIVFIALLSLVMQAWNVLVV